MTLHVLDALRIPHIRLDHPESVPRRIAQALTMAYSANKPVGVLLTRDLMWEDA